MKGLRVEVRFDFRGVLLKLEALKRGVRNRLLRKALRAGSRPLVVAARALVPVRRKVKGSNVTPQKLLKKSLGVKIKTYKGGGIVVAVVGARSKKTQIGTRVRGPHKGQPVYENPANIAHLVEKGHAVGLKKGTGFISAAVRRVRMAARKLTGGGARVPEHPFLDPAIQKAAGAAQEEVRKVLEDGLAQIAREGGT